MRREDTPSNCNARERSKLAESAINRTGLVDLRQSAVLRKVFLIKVHPMILQFMRDVVFRG